MRPSGQDRDGGKECSVSVALFAFGLIAGSAFLVTKEATKYLPAASLTACRMVLGATGLFICNLAVFGCEKTSAMIATCRSMTALVATVGLLNTTIPYTLYAVALTRGVDVSVASVMSGAAPLFASVIAQLFLAAGGEEKQCRGMRLVGLVIGFAGTVVVAVNKQFEAGKLDESSTVGVAAQFIGVLCKACAAILAEHTFRNTERGRLLPAPGLAMGQAFFGALAAIVLALIWDFGVQPSNAVHMHRDVTDHWKDIIPSLLYLGLASSCAVYYLQFFILRHAGGVRQMFVDFLTPAVGITEGAIFLCDFCDATTESIAFAVSGSVMCLLGVVLVQRDAFIVEGKRTIDDQDHYRRLDDADEEAGKLGLVEEGSRPRELSFMSRSMAAGSFAESMSMIDPIINCVLDTDGPITVDQVAAQIHKLLAFERFASTFRLLDGKWCVVPVVPLDVFDLIDEIPVSSVDETMEVLSRISVEPIDVSRNLPWFRFIILKPVTTNAPGSANEGSGWRLLFRVHHAIAGP